VNEKAEIVRFQLIKHILLRKKTERKEVWAYGKKRVLFCLIRWLFWTGGYQKKILLQD